MRGNGELFFTTLNLFIGQSFAFIKPTILSFYLSLLTTDQLNTPLEFLYIILYFLFNDKMRINLLIQIQTFQFISNMNQRQRSSRSVVEKSSKSVEGESSKLEKQKLAFFCLALAKIQKRKKYQGFIKIIAATNAALYKKYTLKNIDRLIVNKNKNKIQFGFQKLNNNRFRFKILLNFARRTLNINTKNKLFCLKLAFLKIYDPSFELKSIKNKTYKRIQDTPIRLMDTSNVTIRSNTSEVSRSSKSISVESRSRFSKKNVVGSQIPLDMAQLQEQNEQLKLMALSEDVKQNLMKLQRFDRFIYPMESQRILKKPVQNQLRRLQKIKNDSKVMRKKYYDNELTITCLYNHVKLVYEMNRDLEERESLKGQRTQLLKKMHEIKTQHMRQIRQLKDKNRMLEKGSTKNPSPEKIADRSIKKQGGSEEQKILSFIGNCLRQKEFGQVLNEIQLYNKKVEGQETVKRCLNYLLGLVEEHQKVVVQRKAQKDTNIELNNSLDKVVKLIRTNKYEQLQKHGIESKIKNIKLLVELLLKNKKSSDEMQKKQKAKSTDGKSEEINKNKLKRLQDQIKQIKQELSSEKASNGQLQKMNKSQQRQLNKLKTIKKELDEVKEKNRQLIKQQKQHSHICGKEEKLQIERVKKIEEELEAYKNENRSISQYIGRIQKLYRFKKYDQIQKQELPQLTFNTKINNLINMLNQGRKDAHESQNRSSKNEQAHKNQIKQLQTQINNIQSDKYNMIQALKNIDRQVNKGKETFYKEKQNMENMFNAQTQKRKFHSLQTFLLQVKVLVLNICNIFRSIQTNKETQYSILQEQRSASIQKSQTSSHKRRQKQYIGQVDRLKKQIQNYIGEQKRVLEQLYRVQNDKNKCIQEYDAISKQLMIFRQDNQILLKELNKQKQTNERLSNENTTITRDLQICMQTNNKLTNENITITRDMQMYMQTNQRLTNENITITRDMQTCVNENNMVKNDIDMIINENAIMKEDIKILLQENNEYKNIKKSNSTLEKIQNQYIVLQNQFKKYREQCRLMQMEIHKYKQINQELTITKSNTIIHKQQYIKEVGSLQQKVRKHELSQMELRNQVELLGHKNKELVNKIHKVSQQVQTKQIQEEHQRMRKYSEKMNSQFKEIVNTHEMEKEELRKYAQKSNAQLQSNIISFNEERKIFREEIERVRNEEYQINYQKIKKQRDQIRELKEEIDQLTSIIQNNEKNFHKVVEENKNMYDRINELQQAQGQMMNQIRYKAQKLQEANHLISKIQPLQEKLRIFQNIIQSHNSNTNSQNNSHILQEDYQQKERLKQENTVLIRQKQRQRQQTQMVMRQKSQLLVIRQSLVRQKETVIRQKEVLMRQIQQMHKDKQCLLIQRQGLCKENEMISRQRQSLLRNNESLVREKQTVGNQKQSLQIQLQGKNKQKQFMLRDRQIVVKQKQQLEKEIYTIKEELKSKQQIAKSIQKQYKDKQHHHHQQITQIKQQLHQRELTIVKLQSNTNNNHSAVNLKQKELASAIKQKYEVQQRNREIEKQLLVTQLNFRKEVEVLNMNYENVHVQMRHKQEHIQQLNAQNAQGKVHRQKLQTQLMGRQHQVRQKQILIIKLQQQNKSKERIIRQGNNNIQNSINEKNKQHLQESIRSKQVQVQSMKMKVFQLQNEKQLIQQSLNMKIQNINQKNKQYISEIERAQNSKNEKHKQVIEAQHRIRQLQSQVRTLTLNSQSTNIKEKHLASRIMEKEQELSRVKEEKSRVIMENTRIKQESQEVIMGIKGQYRELKNIVNMLDSGNNYDDENQVNILMKISGQVSALIDRNTQLQSRIKMLDMSTQTDDEWYQSIQILIASLVQYLKENKLVNGNYNGSNIQYQKSLNELDLIDDNREKYFIYIQNLIKNLFQTVVQTLQSQTIQYRTNVQEIGNCINQYFRSGNKDYLQQIYKITK